MKKTLIKELDKPVICENNGCSVLGFVYNIVDKEVYDE